MKFSENWLRQHVPTAATREQLAATLTAIGLEVEEVTALGAALDGVVVARIVSAEKHPEADRLQVCQVDTGAGMVQIVCGAPNARAGLVAPLATVGATLPGGIAIKAAKLRGVESFGMLCSAKELGVDADASGLLELPVNAVVGAPLAEFLGLPDASIEIKLTPNRADCFSVRGIAFDVAAATGSAVAALDIAPVPAASEATMQVELNAGADVPRYCGRVIEGVDATAPTPVWMAERLRRSGVRPVSLLVDVTQYVMLDIGQPMHAFDRDTLAGPVGVRHARAGEVTKLLNGQDVTLDEQFLAITDGRGDAQRVIALGGIMGGFDSRVTDATRNVFLEAAHFAPAAIIGRGRKLGLHTDAGHRFERGVDPELPRIAIEYATRLILDIAGGRPGPVIEAALPEHLPQPQPVALRRARLARVLGLTVPDAEVERILQALGLAVERSDDGWHVTPPSRRFDIAIEEDLIEEVARIHGYDAIPTTLPGGASRLVAPSETRVDTATVRRQLAARDYLEAVNYAFVDAAWLELWQAGEGAVPLANPLSAELGVMRTMLLPGLVAALGRNASRQQDRVRLFELGNVFRHNPDGSPLETQRVAAAVCGAAHAEQWGVGARPVGFHDLRGDLDSLAAASGARLDYRPSAQVWAHPGRSADIYRVDGGREQRLGWIGQLHPRLQRALDLKLINDGDVIAFELDLGPLVERAIPKAGAQSKYPSVRRDRAFIVADSVPWAAIQATVHAAAGPSLRELVLFDRYQGKGVETGFKSLAMGLILQDESRTLTDRDVDTVVAEVTAAVEREHGAKLRA
ncbi:phenylalanine--tRNA ligase subunit beta [Lysobacter gummosus]|uniref:Phenylalanine--tRNA ligase beta subunit n=1 Tax=Lysobacter gummosus TaxID=262324 RepID=A0ABY3X662_9GAMM|nr:phenylalanine--tRNA ligase subunit beta [Lysobacter gummosus]ALN92477.1 phenylalanine--tRNA ligase, beta subunit [Lysobacter gummosus]UNP28054.1 phenylalanine--tRNA ligase subunit beta [Lysobacter gummosus]